MSFNFYSPWIDPRWKRVTVPDLMNYLSKHGWAEAKTERKHLRCFELPAKPGPVWMPTLIDADDTPYLLFNAVTQIARVEERYAGAVLDDLLAAKPPEPIAPATSEGVAHQAVRS